MSLRRPVLSLLAIHVALVGAIALILSMAWSHEPPDTSRHETPQQPGPEANSGLNSGLTDTAGRSQPGAKTEPGRSGSRLSLPDGKTVPVLNGAYGAPALRWPEDRPWSPIIGKEVDAKGYEWYVHGDGSKTITQMTFHSQLGREVPVTRLFNPVPALPIHAPELEEARKQ